MIPATKVFTMHSFRLSPSSKAHLAPEGSYQEKSKAGASGKSSARGAVVLAAVSCRRDHIFRAARHDGLARHSPGRARSPRRRRALVPAHAQARRGGGIPRGPRSEERRVGKESRSRRGSYHKTKKNK